MNLLWLFLILALGGLLFMWAEPFLVMPLVLPIALFKNEKNPLVYIIGVVATLWQMYVLLAWCIVALFFTMGFSTKPGVQHRWMYYVLGFLGCLAPIQGMASYDREPDKAVAVKQSVAIIVVAVAFIAFQFVPYLMIPWAWLVRFLVHRYF
jgi:hypothetical protein